MAERFKNKWLEEEKIIDLIVGPDAYRDLPILLSKVEDGKSSINVLFSKEETYADVLSYVSMRLLIQDLLVLLEDAIICVVFV